MSALVDQAIEAVRKLPQDTQDEVARLMLALAADIPAQLEHDELAAINEAEAEIARGELVPPSVIQAFWRAHGL
jgi:hypothetical protein